MGSALPFDAARTGRRRMTSQSERRKPTRDEVLSYLKDRTNWGRWGADDGKGAINLITAEKRLDAARSVQKGRTVSLSRPWATMPGLGNPNPAQHFMRWFSGPNGSGGATDYYGISYHGYSTTHLDALCHVWDGNGMWNGRDPNQEINSRGTRFADVDQFKDGIVTRGVLLDVVKHRGEPFVTEEQPVHGWELSDIAAEQGVTLEPGDAVLVYSGRENWHKQHPEWAGGPHGPGLHASTLPFLRDNDVSILGWDMMDASPNEYDVSWTVHGALYAYGVALLDNALLEPLAAVCAEEGRYTFMLTIAPLRVSGGTGSPANPIALF
jgi:kynurenine formamidase